MHSVKLAIYLRLPPLRSELIVLCLSSRLQGVKIKMDDAGNILVRRYAKSNVYVKSTAANPSDETAIGQDILKSPNLALENEKIVKVSDRRRPCWDQQSIERFFSFQLFDMKKFQSNVNRELRRAYPDRRRLETQCLSLVAFVKSENDILDCPIWVLIVNVVAMDMLKSKLPPGKPRPLAILVGIAQRSVRSCETSSTLIRQKIRQ